MSEARLALLNVLKYKKYTIPYIHGVWACVCVYVYVCMYIYTVCKILTDI